VPIERVDLSGGDGMTLPEVGDIVELDQGFTGPDGKPMGVVFCVAADGSVRWVADVYDAELELLPDDSLRQKEWQSAGDQPGKNDDVLG
jgi:hypothetical protein